MIDDPFSVEGFVERFEHRRCQQDSVNACVDEPAIMSRVRALEPRATLELGCATGHLTQSLAEVCQCITAVDRSELMVSRAKSINSSKNVEFVWSAFEDFVPTMPYDLVVSGMTMHLVEDFDHLVRSIFEWIKPGGHFLFTQRHPMRTANPDGDCALADELGWLVSDYFASGRRRYRWLDHEVEYFHRTVTEVTMGLIAAGFTISEIAEPQPTLSKITARVLENKKSPSVLLMLCQRPVT